MSICPHCGSPEAKAKGRSVPQHRRFFAMVRAFYHHWPEYLPYQPGCAEELRAYGLVKAGYRNVAQLEPDVFGAVCIRTESHFPFFFEKGGKVYCASAKSIRFEKLGHKEACKVFDDVSCVFEAVTGLTCDEVMKETERAA